MARRLRIKVPGHAAVYHVVTRTNGQEYRLDDHMKEYFITTLQKLSSLFYTRYCSWSAMDNHTHLLICFRDPEEIDPKEAMERWNTYHEKEYQLNASVEAYRKYVVRELTDVSSFMKRLNLLMTRAYNRHTGKQGTLWQSRFHSTIFERGLAAVRCAAYIELNSFRASMVNKPEDYEYSSLNYLKQGNRDGLIDIDLLEEGLGIAALFKDLTDRNAFTRELYKTYCAYVYEAGAKPKGGKERGIVITEAMRERLRKYGIQGEKGSFLRRAWEYSKSVFMGNSDFAKRFYDEHINPGYSGKDRRSHIQKWIHTSGQNLWSVFSVLHPELNLRDGP